MEQMQQKPKWTKLPLLSMIFGIAAALLYAGFRALYSHPTYSSMFSEWADAPTGILIALTGIMGGFALAVLAVVFGIIGLVKRTHARPRSAKYLVFSIIGLIGAAAHFVMVLLSLSLRSVWVY